MHITCGTTAAYAVCVVILVLLALQGFSQGCSGLVGRRLLTIYHLGRMVEHYLHHHSHQGKAVSGNETHACHFLPNDETNHMVSADPGDNRAMTVNIRYRLI